MTTKLVYRVNEIFTSIDGEQNHYGVGTQSTFVRFQGCNLNCEYCDTPKARLLQGGFVLNLEELVSNLQFRKPYKITLTGGEPLLQRNLNTLISQIYKHVTPRITVETNGTLPIFTNNPGMRTADYVVDIKLDPKVLSYTRFQDIFNLCPTDTIKLVVSTQEELGRAIVILRMLKHGGCKATLCLGPVHGPQGKLQPKDILEALVRCQDLREVRYNDQLHKYTNLK